MMSFPERMATKVTRHARHLPLRVGLAAGRLSITRRLLGVFLDFPFDPYDPAFIANPYPAYRRLRERGPVTWTSFGLWLVTGYEEAITVLTDARFEHPDYRSAIRQSAAPGALKLSRSNSFISLNPPDHTRLRRTVSEAFASQSLPEMRSRIQHVANELLDRAEPKRQMDLVTEFALPLPVRVVSHLFGMSTDEAARCQVWVREAASAVELMPGPATLARADAATIRLNEYFSALIHERRARPGLDLTSALVRAQQRDPSFRDEELVATCVLLFGAGHETAAAFLGMAVHTLLSHRHAWDALRRDPRLTPGAVEELLRYEPPAQAFARQVREDLTLGGKRIRRGQSVMVLVGALNRDPARFPDPDEVDVGRANNQHSTFGHGIHACFGAHIARMEGQVGLAALVARLPGLRLGGEPRWRKTLMLRALESLPVVW
jgi:cytochrome P450